jgi:hypothetical protein
MRVRASCAHWCGLMQPSSLSQAQSRQAHVGIGRCGLSGLGVRILSDIIIRSTTIVTACFLRRHLAGVEVIGLGVASGWYHAGSWARSWVDRRIAAMFT